MVIARLHVDEAGSEIEHMAGEAGVVDVRRRLVLDVAEGAIALAPLDEARGVRPAGRRAQMIGQKEGLIVACARA